jgi:hypothetical protein
VGIVILWNGDRNDKIGSKEFARVLNRFGQPSPIVYSLAYVTGKRGYSEEMPLATDDIRYRMIKLAEFTSGKSYEISSLDDLYRKYTEIVEDLRTRYRISYFPKTKSQDGNWRRISVKAKGGHRVWSRSGYLAVNPNEFHPMATASASTTASAPATPAATATAPKHDKVRIPASDIRMEYLSHPDAVTMRRSVQFGTEGADGVPTSIVTIQDNRETAAVNPARPYCTLQKTNSALPGPDFGRSLLVERTALKEYEPLSVRYWDFQPLILRKGYTNSFSILNAVFARGGDNFVFKCQWPLGDNEAVNFSDLLSIVESYFEMRIGN